MLGDYLAVEMLLHLLLDEGFFLLKALVDWEGPLIYLNAIFVVLFELKLDSWLFHNIVRCPFLFLSFLKSSMAVRLP